MKVKYKLRVCNHATRMFFGVSCAESGLIASLMPPDRMGRIELCSIIRLLWN